MLSRRVISPVVLIACVSIAASSFAAERPVLDTVEDIEDVRLLWSATAYRVHQLDTLLRYAKGFGAEVDPGEATDWHEQALYVLEWLKSLDDAGMGLMAWQDYRQREADVSEDVRRTRALLGDAADRVTRLHDRLQRRVTEVRGQVDDLARERGLQPPAARATEPWAEPQREIGREMGFALSWFMWMNRDPASRHAALDRQQNLEVDYLLNKAAKIGVRSIVPEFSGHENLESCSWRVCEPKPGEYDFSRIDANIEKIAEHGMVTVVPIRSMTTDPPDWAIEQFGDESRMWRHDEKTDETAPTQGVNLMHRRTREAFGAYLAALVSHLSKTHPDRVMAITLEVRQTELAAEVDYSPAAARHFRDWLRERYGRIEKLNERWDRGHESFDEVSIPAPRREPPHLALPGEEGPSPLDEAAVWRDWIKWRKAYVTDYFTTQAELVREHWPNVPVIGFAIEANSHHAHSERPVETWPLHGLANLLDLPGSMATVEPVQVLLQAVGDGRFLSQQAEQNFGSMLGGAAYSGLLKGVLYTVARDGPDKILRYFYSPGLYSYMDRQLDWDGAYSFRLKAREMNRLGPLIANTRPTPTPMAVLWSEHSYDQDPTRYSRYGALGAAYALMCAKVHYDLVTEQLIAGGALDDYRWLIVPEQRYLTDETVEKIRAWVEGGGTLFATSVPGMFDEYGRHRGHPLADVFGTEVDEFTPIQAVTETFLVPVRPHSVWDNRERGTDWRRKHRFHPDEWTLHGQLALTLDPGDGAEVLHRFVDGRPAMTGHQFGDGRAIMFGYPFGHEYAYSNRTEMSFGKIYPAFAYPPQMTSLERWLGQFVRGTLEYPQQVEVPRSWMARFTGRERRAPAMTYPGFGDNYRSKRVETDEPNHGLTVGLRDRPPGETTYLTVWNRESAYATTRGYAHFMASPTYAIIRVNRTDVASIYDVVNRCFVPVVKGDLSKRNRRGEVPDQDECVSFVATLPPYFGRVYALSTRSQPELFELSGHRGISDAELHERTSALADPWTPPDVMVWGEDEVKQWWAARTAADRERAVVISYGTPAYRPAAEHLAEALRRAGAEVVLSGRGVVHRTDDPDPYYRLRGARYRRTLDPIDVYIGNDYNNTNLADFSGGWQSSRATNPIQRVSINRAFPGGDRAIVTTTRPFFVNTPGGRGRQFENGFHEFKARPSSLVLGASSPEGAMRAAAKAVELVGQ